MSSSAVISSAQPAEPTPASESITTSDSTASAEPVTTVDSFVVMQSGEVSTSETNQNQVAKSTEDEGVSKEGFLAVSSPRMGRSSR